MKERKREKKEKINEPDIMNIVKTIIDIVRGRKIDAAKERQRNR